MISFIIPLISLLLSKFCVFFIHFWKKNIQFNKKKERLNRNLCELSLRANSVFFFVIPPSNIGALKEISWDFWKETVSEGSGNSSVPLINKSTLIQQIYNKSGSGIRKNIMNLVMFFFLIFFILLFEVCVFFFI